MHSPVFIGTDLRRRLWSSIRRMPLPLFEHARRGGPASRQGIPDPDARDDAYVSAPKGVVQALRFELVKDRFTAGSNGSHLAVHLMEPTGGAAKNAGTLSSCLVSARV